MSEAVQPPVAVSGERSGTWDERGSGRSAPTRAPMLVVLVSVPLAVATCVAALALTGGTVASLLLDAGALVRWGTPVVRVVHDAAAVTTIGLLGTALGLLPDSSGDRWRLTGARQRLVRWAGAVCAVWALAGAAGLVLNFALIAGAFPRGDDGLAQLAYFATSVELGRALLVSLVLVVLAAHLALLATRAASAAVALAVAVAGLLVLALAGHSAGSDDHATGVSSLAVHLLGVTVWSGGILALLVLRRWRVPAPELSAVARRFSVVAGWSFAAVAASGVANATLRVDLAGLSTPYAAVLLIKALLLVVLGLAGWWHRRSLLPALTALPGASGPFTRLIAGELVVMAAAVGLSVALSRSDPPVAEDVTTGPDALFRSLTGFAPPPPLSAASMVTTWNVDWLWLALALTGAVLYLLAARRLRARGDTWPHSRAAAWLAGCALLVWTTSGGPAVYGKTAFSGHMLQHVLLMMGVPPLLVLGAPVLLALRALPARRDASAGPREWLLQSAHSRVSQVLTHPAVAGLVLSGSLVVFYYTELFELALSTHPGHTIMMVHFLASGYLFGWALIGVDPAGHRASHPARLLVALVTMAFHALFAVSLMAQTTVLAEDWWTSLGATDTGALLQDQATGASIALAAGEILTALLLLGVAVLWVRASEREARRRDRAADLDGDAQLAAYNALLRRGADSERR